VPVGHVPRSIVCHVRGEITRRVGPGDIVKLDGVFLPVPFGGYQQVFAGLLTDTYLHVMRLKRALKSYSEYKLTPVLLDQVEKVAASPDAYTRLAMSIAPEIFGHLDVKKALLLMMVGGVTRHLPDGMNIRGDINICLMGDPGVAKSQLLKHIAHSAPRGIYTSGKGSSGVGLTAAVLKDPVSGEFVLEGGSLVLADMGICCIDEFDKMADADRTSIHEVMEQQSISIAKAGITCSLNARTAILAAANPAYGRYNTARTPAENINLPAALLSRFDLLFLLLDKPNWEHDMALGKHIAHVHTHSAAPELEFEPLSSDFLRSYVARAKTFEPFVPEAISDHVVSAYVGMREAEMKDQANAKSYTTARTLLAILRLSQALAKLRFAKAVTVADVDEAIRLMNSSKISLMDQGSSKQQAVDTMSSIYDIIRRLAEDLKRDNVPYDEVLRRVIRKGYRQEDLNKTLHEYEQLNVWMVSADKSSIVFL
jgi:DNA replication licensing factor MCM7